MSRDLLRKMIADAKLELARMDRSEDDPRLYDAAREATHSVGMPWTDPRTGITYPPPKSEKQ